MSGFGGTGDAAPGGAAAGDAQRVVAFVGERGGLLAFIGEVVLGGEIRPASHSEARLREASRLGFKEALMAREDPKSMERLSKLGIKLRPVRSLEEALKELWDA